MGQKASPRHAGDGPSSERTVDLPVSALESHETRVRDARKTPLLPPLSAPLLARSLPLPLLSALRFQRPLGPGQDSPAPLPPGSAHLGAADAALRFLGVFSSSPFLSLSPPASPKSSRSCETQLPGRSGQISPGTWDAGRMQSTSSRHVTLRSIDRSITVNPGTKTAKTPCLQMLQSLKTFRPGPSCGSCA